MTSRIARLAGLAAALLAAGCGSGGAPASAPPGRALHDRPDDRRGPQIHFVYAVPGGRRELDHSLDTDGTLTNAVFLMLLWFHGQTDSPALAVDTYHGWPDITYVRLPRTDQAYDRAGPLALMRDVRRAGLNAPGKLYAVFYDGTLPQGDVCGLGESGLRPFAIVYLAQAACPYEESLAAGGVRSPLVFAMAHEIVHELGFVPACAPNASGGHVHDDPRDLMAPVLSLKTPTLDADHDDYFLAHVHGCPDLSRSPFIRMHSAPLRPPG